MAGVAELLAGFVEGVGSDGEEDFAGGAADEVEAALLLDELELGRHAADRRRLNVNSRRAKSRSLGCARDDNFFEVTWGSARFAR